MRKWMLIGFALLAALSCSPDRDLEPVEAPSGEPEGRVQVTFSVAGEFPATKALGESPALETMHVAIFGGSGYLKEYQEAELVSDSGTYDYSYLAADGETVLHKTVPLYTFSFSIALSNSSRRVHFIGNGPSSIPFGRDYEVLPSLLGEKETGFWQMVTLTNVTALRDGDGDYVYPDINTKRQSGDPYLPSNELLSAFSNIPLIRNWAKIELKSKPAGESNFTPYSFAVVNMPKYGTLVPYGGDKGFITNYKDLSFDQLRGSGYNYEGNLPSDVEFNHDIPGTDDFENCTGGVKRYDPDAPEDSEDHTVYLYERPVPNSKLEPTYVIVYGLYKNPADDTVPSEGLMCYYKVDLMAGSEYYPVLRNFKYEIQIDKISARGYDTPDAAAAAAGSADVSADINASGLPDISDGTRRMAIQHWMSKTFIRAEEKSEQLYVKFFDDINGDDPEPNLRPESVYYELIPENGGIIKDLEIGNPVTETSDAENYGWRPISFGIASPGEAAVRTQTLRILCKTDPDNVEESPLYRDIVISLLPTQPMRVSCESERVLMVRGESQRVDVAIPDGLVESMFPLYFIIEAKNLSLTPDTSVDDSNLPVISEKSIVGDYQTFHFQRTLEWEEYNNLQARLDYEDESLWRTFSSYFKTNCEDSATEIYVANEFFYPGQASFTNYASFRKPRFTSSVPRESGREVTVAAEQMSARDSYDRVYLDLTGLEPAEGSGIQTDPQTGEYYYDPSDQAMTFTLKTTTDDGEVSVGLRSADGRYEPVTIKPWRFRNLSIMDMSVPNGNQHQGTGNSFSHVAYGYVTSYADRPLLVGYYTDPDSYKYLEGNKKLRMSVPAYNGVKSVNPWDDTGNVSSTAQDYYREKWFTTTAGYDAVSVTISCAGYVEETVSAPRFFGSIYSLDISSSADWTTFVSNGGLFQKNITVSNAPNGLFTLELVADKDVQKHDSSNGIVLPAGGHYELEADITSSNSDVYLYYAQVFYYVYGTTPQRPRSVSPEPDGSIYYGYLGNNYEYMWNLPWSETGGKLVMDAPSNRDIVITRIVLRGFHGIRNDSGNAGGGDIGLGGGLNDGGNL
ncbi:MAG: hypothetical protein IJU68_02705 [Bacteroidales bacterium]|nr:hypothetical protein [Bacteroidales bacterium]